MDRLTREKTEKLIAFHNQTIHRKRDPDYVVNKLVARQIQTDRDIKVTIAARSQSKKHKSRFFGGSSLLEGKDGK